MALHLDSLSVDRWVSIVGGHLTPDTGNLLRADLRLAHPAEVSVEPGDDFAKLIWKRYRIGVTGVE